MKMYRYCRMNYCKSFIQQGSLREPLIAQIVDSGVGLTGGHFDRQKASAMSRRRHSKLANTDGPSAPRPQRRPQKRRLFP
jgi:hypothetical protein